jgi:hypothetical protein
MPAPAKSRENARDRNTCITMAAVLAGGAFGATRVESRVLLLACAAMALILLVAAVALQMGPPLNGRRSRRRAAKLDAMAPLADGTAPRGPGNDIPRRRLSTPY